MVGHVPEVPLRSHCADLVYTGKGALIRLPDLFSWAVKFAWLLSASGHLFVCEAHPAVPLWTWDADQPRIPAGPGLLPWIPHQRQLPRPGRATKWQWTLGEVIKAVLAAGLQPVHVAEHAESFWRPDGVDAAACGGLLPNTFTLLARRR